MKASINAVFACVSIYIRQLSSFRAPTLYRSDYNYLPYSIYFSEFMSILFSRENGQNTKILEVRYQARKALILRELL